MFISFTIAGERPGRLTGDAHLAQTDADGVDDVGPFPPKVWVWLVFDDEDNVGRDAARGLVTLTWEGNLGALLPATLDLDRQDLVLGAGSASVSIQATPRDFHALGAAVKDLLERDAQFVMNRRVLLAPRLPVPRETVQVETAKGAERVPGVHFHVLIVSAVHLESESAH